MIQLALLLQVAQPAPPIADGPILREQGTLILEGEFVPALLPYLRCVNDASTAETDKTPIFSGEAMLAAQRRAVAKCSAQRAAAKADALKMVGNDASTQDREAQIDRALYAIEHSKDEVAERLDVLNSRSPK